MFSQRTLIIQPFEGHTDVARASPKQDAAAEREQ
jgi:hypothetical protein